MEEGPDPPLDAAQTSSPGPPTPTPAQATPPTLPTTPPDPGDGAVSQSESQGDVSTESTTAALHGEQCSPPVQGPPPSGPTQPPVLGTPSSLPLPAPTSTTPPSTAEDQSDVSARPTSSGMGGEQSSRLMCPLPPPSSPAPLSANLPASQSTESIAPTPNPQAETPTAPNPPKTQESPKPGRTQSTKDAGKVAEKGSAKSRKDQANSQQATAGQQGIVGREKQENTEAAPQQRQKPAQPVPAKMEKVFGNHKPQAAAPNLSAENVGKDQECGKVTDRSCGGEAVCGSVGAQAGPTQGQEAALSSAPTGTPVDTPSSVNKNDPSDEEGFQTVTSKKRKRKQQQPPQITQNVQPTSSESCITAYFHAILSKDFKLNPAKDLVYLRAGHPLGDWNKEVAKMEVTRNLGQHGFLVEGQLLISKKMADVPIPYKYVVYKAHGDGYEVHFEYIYKTDAADTVNRCLCIMQRFLTPQDEWHQYDDIICAEPDRGILTLFKSLFGLEEDKDIARGRHLAGKIMLEAIFDLLRSWSAVNVQNFFIQLQQFFVVYCSALVFEGAPKAWASLGFGQNEVRNLLKEFLLENVVPVPGKAGGASRDFLKDPLKEALITMLVWSSHLKLDSGEQLSALCNLLCLPHKPREEFCSYWKELAGGFQYDQGVKMVLKTLQDFCNLALKQKIAKWVLVLPLLHLLRGDCRPFETPSPSAGSRFETWAGLQGLSVSNSQPNVQFTRALMKVMTAHTHLVEVDGLLARSWMSVLGVEALEEYCLAVPVDLLDVLHRLSWRLSAEFEFRNEAVQHLMVYLSNAVKEHKFRCHNDGYGEVCLKTTVKLLEKICQLATEQKHHELPLSCLALIGAIAHFTACSPPQEMEANREELKRRNGELLMQTLRMTRNWLSSTFRQKLLRSVVLSISFTSKYEIEAWNNVLSLTFDGEEFTEHWRKTLQNDFQGKMKKERHLHQIGIYCTEIEEVSRKFPALAVCLENCALDAVTSICQEKPECSLFDWLKGQDFCKFGKLVSAIILKTWPQDSSGHYLDGEETVIEHLLTWSAAKNVFQLQGTDGKLSGQLTDRASKRIAVAISAFTSVSDKFLSGNIQIKTLNRIFKKKDAFLELLKIDCLSLSGRCESASAMQSLLRCREEEVKSIFRERDLLQNLLAVCRNLKGHIRVDVENLERKLRVNVESMILGEFMEVHRPDELSSEAAGMVTFYSIPPGSREMAEALLKFKDSFLFKMCWESSAMRSCNDGITEQSRAGLEPPASLVTVSDVVFQPCYRRYRGLYEGLKTGQLMLEEVDRVFQDYKDKYEELTEDLEVMSRLEPSEDKRWIHRRVQQIEQYHQLHLALESAKVFAEVQQMLCLRGDFRVLETLLAVTNVDFKREALDRIDNDLMKAKKELVDITEPRRQCLQELCLRGSFVKWVREALQDLNELKVFLDLASISAGENPLDVDRVACFHDAVLGYSSVLYELKPEAGFRDLRRVLGKLWKALKNDSNLPKKLRDTARHLEWLKTVKESHGSVELSSLSLASSINQRGVYIISVRHQNKLSLDMALKLEIPEEEPGEEAQEVRSYSLEDLRELQNKLMLMSGKGEQGQGEVDRFAEAFSSVQRLAVAFIDLHTAGNPLFRQWEARISCSPQSEACITMDFQLSSSLGEIKMELEGDVLEQLPPLCRNLEGYLEVWRDFMDQQRSKHYYLNYYTAEQVVYLCDCLVPQKRNVGWRLEDQVATMLSFIMPSRKGQEWDLRGTLRDLLDEICAETQKEHEEAYLEMFVEGEGPGSMEAGPALPTEAPRGLLDQADGLVKLDLVWKAYMRDMRGFLPNTLDVPRLGRLLGMLAKDEQVGGELMEMEGEAVKRCLPAGFTSGRPNLIICPRGEVLTSCLCVYMASEAEPLPTYDEVLLCDPTTPYQQVELFLRRCLTAGGAGQKIYTLLHADQLPYDVSYRAEQLLQRLMLCCGHDYRLVIICSAEREHAYIPSAFSQYRLLTVPLEPLGRIQSYLSQHYTVGNEQPTAADVFKGRQFIGVVSSKRAGVGKSLYIQRLHEKLNESAGEDASLLKCIRLIEPKVDENVILRSLMKTPDKKQFTIFHFDVTSSVQKGLHEFLFKLLVLRYLMDAEGRMWKCSSRHLYVIEILQPARNLRQNIPTAGAQKQFSFLDIFPRVLCRPPKEVLALEMRGKDSSVMDDPLMDDQEFRSEAYQRPYQYLTRFHNRHNLDLFEYRDVEGTHAECLQILFFYCGIMDPSWAELRNFTWFLNVQLKDCETSVFCDMNFVGDTLQGFRNFVVDFMILMAKDFATPSLSISDQSPGRVQQTDLAGVNEEDLAPFRIRKRWESEPHPYIFFNGDRTSMTFIGFHLRVNGQNGVDAVHSTSGEPIKRNVMSKRLYRGLQLQRVPFNIDFDGLPRGEKIERLCNVLGVPWPFDTDETYELTTDNILKMLAIHMRFRCGIPVVVMGETGCGKTRLIRFLCELRRAGANAQNMTLVKVHGGTTSEMIYNKVREAEAKATSNKQEHKLDSVLFFDEANTTEAVSSIKEVLCDRTVEGEHLVADTGLQIIAACNPYRRHSDKMIRRLESAGLGYRVRAEETENKLGSIPLRQLVYRVQVLPPSMIPLVWDFGQLNDLTEKIYIQQIVRRVVQAGRISAEYVSMITDVLSSSQRYMRSREDECSFVSLRDVERCMQVFGWFHNNHNMLLGELGRFLGQNQKRNRQHPERSTLDLVENREEQRDPVVWALVMAVGVCYHACLENKDGYRAEICKSLPEEFTPQRFLREITQAQDLLLSGVPLGKTIARNGALKENVFMMVVCIELRIPLFLVGKPGSSKSLSKTLVADAMQGQAAHSELYKKLKQIHLVSFQCSPHSTPEGIINTFRQCARFQERKNLGEYVSVVVLDEIGLAEDSPKMPLKTLHPLLEEGCIDDEPLPHKKVGFIGISNWALDPAKMNRGIFVSRGDPDENELIESAKGICSSDRMVLEKVQDVFQPFAEAYLKISEGKGFFGLRDYYSLIKMVFAFAKASKQRPSAERIVEAVLRNFSGRDDMNVVSVFTDSLCISPDLESISTIELVKQNISAVGSDDESRYLLVLTKNYVALQILQQIFFSDLHQPEIIFGSSFPKDQEYTQICRNINRVKICMETGQTVVLLNLQNLYESLYDALNQYYVYLGGQKYVDLGLGTHRVKCRVHPDFRLIVIEEKEVVYEQFPIPLINRLEKHYLDINAVLGSNQKEAMKELEEWVEYFVSPKNECLGAATASWSGTGQKYHPADVFIGYHSDTCSTVVLQVTERLKQEKEGAADLRRRVLEEAKLIMLNCATPDAVVRLYDTALPSTEIEHLTQVYSEEQKHGCLAEFIQFCTCPEGSRHLYVTEVTTFSRLLTGSDIKWLQNVVEIPSIELLSLQQFDTEYSFLKKIRSFLDSTPDDKILIIQTDFDEGSQSANILASAKYSAINEINKTGDVEMTGQVFVYFITKLPRIEGGTSYVGFHGGNWSSVHIDDLRRSKDMVWDVNALRNLSISQLFEEKADQLEAMELDEPGTEQPRSEYSKVLDTTAVVRSCVQSAVSMLRDQDLDGARCTRRVEILLMLLADNEELGAVFLKTMKRRLHSLLVAQDSHTLLPNEWVFKEASNINALQEGGTFKHTLWKRIQAAVIPLLAQLVSVLDRDHNLDLLLDRNSRESVKKLWLDIFEDETLLDIPYAAVNRKTESQSILVQSCMGGGADAGCAMPFSWRIREHLEEVWAQVQLREDHALQAFEGIFEETPLGQHIAQAGEKMQEELFHRYLQDFISMTMKVASRDKQQLLCGALASCISELRLGHTVPDKGPSLPWVHIAYHRFRNRLQNLLRMVTLVPHIAAPLLGNRHARESREMVLDVFAALACVELLETQVLETSGQRLVWLRQVKSLQVPMELVCCQGGPSHGGEVTEHVRSGWNQIFVLSLFVENLFLEIESMDADLQALVLDHCRMLRKVLEESSDLKQETAFVAVIEVLKSCKDAASSCIFQGEFEPCPMCMRDPQEPVLLPCSHLYCQECAIQWLVPGQMYCLQCMLPVPDDFRLQVSEHLRGLVMLNAAFRKRCTAFFINVVSSVCFRGDRPPSHEVIMHLLSFLTVEAGPVPLIRDRQILTKALSPFREAVDQNPVVRSVVLKLLLKYSFDEVKDYLQQHLSWVEQSIILEEGDKTNLYALYINCLEDSMLDRLQGCTAAGRKSCLQGEGDFLRCFLASTHESAQTPASAQTITVEQLQEVARVRLCLDAAAELLTAQLQGTPTDPQITATHFLGRVEDLCTRSGNDWYRVYLIRRITAQHGLEFVQNLLRDGELDWLFPQEIHQQQREDGGQMDQYLVCGEDYKAIRDAVAKATVDLTGDGIDAACEACRGTPAQQQLFLLLALFREVTTLYRSTNPALHPSPQLLKLLEDFIGNSRVLVSPAIRTFAVVLVQNGDPLFVRSDRPAMEHTLMELTVHLAAVLLCGNGGVLTPLRQLALTPANMQRSFLPTMPEDVQFMAVNTFTEKLTWYICLKGHLCAVGECGRPVQRGKCLDCGSPIGGEKYRPEPGFIATQTRDRSQTGHILGSPSRRGDPEGLDTRDMSPVPFTLLRMLTHMAMLLGVAAEPQSVAQIIRPPIPDPGVFLMGHLLKDLEQLSRALRKGTDDTVSAIHLVIRSLLESQPSRQGRGSYDELLSTRAARRSWEASIADDVITPRLKDLDQRLKEVNASLRGDLRVACNPVVRVVFGDPCLFLPSLPKDSLIHRGAVWSCRERVSLPNLAHILEQNHGKDAFPLLWTFLQKEAELRLVKSLPDIVALQKELVRRFQNGTDLSAGSIEDFIQSQTEGSASLQPWEKNIKTFLSVWNQLRPSLATNGEIKLPAEFCQEDLDLRSDLQVLLPRRQGLGLCSTALVSYLIALHNHLIYAMEKHMGEENSYTVGVSDLTDMHMIGYEPERDLIPLVLSSCQHSLERGQETLSQYDLPRVQQLVLTRLLQGKPHISLEGMPTLVSRQERDYESLLMDVKGKVSQEPLPALRMAALGGELQAFSDVCEAVGVAEVVLSFLAATGGEAHMDLVPYLEQVLQMGDQVAPHILKALSSCSLKHCVALWQFLSSLKSESMLRLKRDPFVGISGQYRQHLGEEAQRQLSGFCSRGSVEALLEMHQFMLLHLKHNCDPLMYRPDWGLKETLQSYLERKDVDTLPDIEEFFPEDILLSQAVETWKFIVVFRQRWNPR